MDKLAPSPLDPLAAAVADRLHAQSKKQIVANVPAIAGRMAVSLLRDRSADFTQGEEGRRFVADKLVAIAPAKAALIHMLCRSIGATRIVEAGTSFGVSTIYLAAAVRDTLAERGGGGEGIVIGTEHEPTKVQRARRNLREAGVEEFVEIREGDLRETLVDLTGPIDFILVDIWVPMALPVLRLVTPHLRPGALVVCDNVVGAAKEYREYLEFVRDPDGPFTSVTVPGNGGMEISRKR
ncbi:class I SAM-dependent methyltransferase [Tsukamurella sp. NPDC003166]|uniref:O-methyltransferase n=1 Tax=Tsukamurella sp. NPDC003166 TaxID=3154444 RepID=UPI0033BCAA1D